MAEFQHPQLCCPNFPPLSETTAPASQIMAAVFLKLSEGHIVDFLPVSSGMRDTASINLVVTKEQVIVYIQPHTQKNFQITLSKTHKTKKNQKQNWNSVLKSPPLCLDLEEYQTHPRVSPGLCLHNIKTISQTGWKWRRKKANQRKTGAKGENLVVQVWLTKEIQTSLLLWIFICVWT